MDTISEASNWHRRRFLCASAATFAAAQLSMMDSAAQTDETHALGSPAMKPGVNTSFGTLRQVDSNVLNIGYAEADPLDGPAVLLLHGWSYDIHTYVDVAPMLAASGYRAIIPERRAQSAPGSPTSLRRSCR